MVRWLTSLTAALMVAATASAARAAEPDPPAQAPEARPVASTSDFFFGAPRAFVNVRGSLLVPRGGGDLFTFVRDQLTLERSDLRARGVGVDVGAVLTPTIDFVVGFDVNRSSSSSEYRHYLASNQQPIAQQTRFGQSLISTGVRFTPGGRGRQVSRYAFIPRRITPFGGGGMSIGYYTFSQRGQFVDYTDLGIFTDSFQSEGWSIGPYVHGGADVQVWKHLFVTFDGRYTWMHSGLDEDFTGFDGIDLAGFRGGTGISIVF
jgi:opacity protein-like surface antigen